MSGVGSLDTGFSTFSTSNCFPMELFSWDYSPSFCSVSTSALDWSYCFGPVIIIGWGPSASTSLPLPRVIAWQCSFPFLLGFTSEVLGNEP